MTDRAAALVLDFFVVPLEHLEPETVLGFDLYLQHGGQDPIHYRAGDQEFSYEVRERLLGHGVTQLLVPHDQTEAYLAYRMAHPEGAPLDVPAAAVHHHHHDGETLTRTVLDTRRPLEQRCKALLGVSREVIEAALAEPERPGAEKRVGELAESTARLLLSDRSAFASLVEMLEADTDVHRHAANTALFATELARASGVRDALRLATIGRAALMHDIGKLSLPAEMSRLDPPDTELGRAEYASHTWRGCERMREAGWTDPACLDVAANHHERCDGSGYPRGLRREQLSLAVRIVAIADVYDTLTTGTPRRTARGGFDALSAMVRERAGQFDPRLLEAFVRSLVRRQR